MDHGLIIYDESVLRRSTVLYATPMIPRDESSLRVLTTTTLLQFDPSWHGRYVHGAVADYSWTARIQPVVQAIIFKPHHILSFWNIAYLLQCGLHGHVTIP